MKTSFNIVYSDKRKFAYFNIAKCGSTSINKLCSEVNIDAVVNPVRGRGVVRKWNHPGIPLEKVKDYFKFTIIRDPLSRLVSCYKNKVTDTNWLEMIFERTEGNFPLEELLNISFPDFVYWLQESEQNLKKDSHWIPYVNVIPTEIDFIARLENIEEDFKIIAEKIGISGHEFPRANKESYESPWQDYYTNELKEIVANLYSEDIELYEQGENYLERK